MDDRSSVLFAAFIRNVSPAVTSLSFLIPQCKNIDTARQLASVITPTGIALLRCARILEKYDDPDSEFTTYIDAAVAVEDIIHGIVESLDERERNEE